MQNSHWAVSSTYPQQAQQSSTGFTMSCSPGRWWSQEDNVFQSGCRSSQSFQCTVHHQGAAPLDRSGSIRPPYHTHRERNINTIRFSCSLYALAKLHMLHYHPYLVTDSNKKEWGLPKSLRGTGVCFPSSAASPSDMLNKAPRKALCLAHPQVQNKHWDLDKSNTGSTKLIRAGLGPDCWENHELHWLQ